MTQNEVSILKNAVLDATEAYVDARLSVLDFVKTQIGVVISATQNQQNKKWYHTVRCNQTQQTAGIVYNNVLSVNNIHFQPNSTVFIAAPNAQFSSQFILGKLDNVLYDIVGGSIRIGGSEETPNFAVDSNGNVTIRAGSININNKFIVDSTGSIDATSGTIGGATIGTDRLSYTSNSIFSENRIGCGFAGRGVINLFGNRREAASGGGYKNGCIQIAATGDESSYAAGLQIWNTGEVNSDRFDTKYFANIPDRQLIYNSDYTVSWSP